MKTHVLKVVKLWTMFADRWATTSSVLNWKYIIPVISVRPRERQPDEITPVSAEQSKTADDNKGRNTADHAIDLDLNTWSHTTYGSSWLEVKLEKTFCILQVIWYNQDGNPDHTWTCSSTDCSTCQGYYCSSYTLTVSIERGSTDDLPLVPHCKYGDTVKLQRSYSGYLSVYELAVIGEQGKNIRYWHIELLAVKHFMPWNSMHTMELFEPFMLHNFRVRMPDSRLNME